MFVVMVHAHAKPERVEEFKQLTLENASNSLKEPGVVRFDIFQQQDDPNRFVFIEIYKSVDDVAKHKETDHYKKWRDNAPAMLAEDRYSIKYSNAFPTDEGWR